MLIHTAKGLSPRLQRQIDGHPKPCHVVDLAEMRLWKLDWWAAAESTGALGLPPTSQRHTTTAGGSAADDPRGGVRSLLLSCGAAVAAIAVGTLTVFFGVHIGVLLVIGGVAVLARQRSTHRQAIPRSSKRPLGGRRRRATSRHRLQSDAWRGDEPDCDDEEDLDDEWEQDDGWDWDDDEPDLRSASRKRGRGPSEETYDDYI